MFFCCRAWKSQDIEWSKELDDNEKNKTLRVHRQLKTEGGNGGHRSFGPSHRCRKWQKSTAHHVGGLQSSDAKNQPGRAPSFGMTTGDEAHKPHAYQHPKFSLQLFKPEKDRQMHLSLSAEDAAGNVNRTPPELTAVFNPERLPNQEILLGPTYVQNNKPNSKPNREASPRIWPGHGLSSTKRSPTDQICESEAQTKVRFSYHHSTVRACSYEARCEESEAHI